jgi:hypothetical protein
LWSWFRREVVKGKEAGGKRGRKMGKWGKVKRKIGG